MPITDNGAVKPIHQNWIDLSTAGGLTLAPDTSLGVHDYSYDIAQGLLGDTTHWAQDAGGLYPDAIGPVGYSGLVVIHPAACSLRYNPYFEYIVFLSKNGAIQHPIILLGLASEAVSDHERLTLHRACQLTNSGTNAATAYARARSTAAVLLGNYTFGEDHYYRVRIDPEDGGYISVTDLGTSPTNWDVTGILDMSVSGHVSMGKQLQGGNVITPAVIFSNLIQWYDCRIVATRTTIRKS